MNCQEARWDGKVCESICWQLRSPSISEQASELCWECQVDCEHTEVHNICTVKRKLTDKEQVVEVQ